MKQRLKPYLWLLPFAFGVLVYLLPHQCLGALLAVTAFIFIAVSAQPRRYFILGMALLGLALLTLIDWLRGIDLRYDIAAFATVFVVGGFAVLAPAWRRRSANSVDTQQG
jgi:hypothetical protein